MTAALGGLLQQHVEDKLNSGAAIEQIRASAPSAASIEATAKTLMFDLCESNQDNTRQVEKLLLLVLDCADESLCGTDLALSMLEEAMDVQTIAGCDTLFAFLETHRTRITRRMGKGMPLLRLCNELLRRLSKTQDTVFCGRILIFLSLVFPLSERSAVNLKGEFNLDNVTTFEQDDESMELDAKTGPEELGGVSPDAIYSTFWAMQASFNNPSQIISAPLIFTRFRQALDTVLEAFENIEKAISKANKGSSSKTATPVDETTEVRAYFTPKVLTSKKLLSLELADLSFRRHILVQTLIVLDYLLALTAENKEAWTKAGPITNKSLANPYVLSAADATWATETRGRVTSLLKNGKNGAQFLSIVETSLRRDSAWLRWKCEGCPAYDLPTLDETRLLEAPKKLATLTSAKKPYMYKVGNAVLSKLWTTAGGWTDGELEHGKSIPDPESYLKPIQALEEEIKDTMQEEEVFELEDKKASKSWRALRTARFSHLQYFTLDVAGGDVEKFVETLKHPPSQQTETQDETKEAKSNGQGVASQVNEPSDTVSTKRPAPETTSEISGEKRQRLMNEEESQV